MKGIILAGGSGTRLYPMTKVVTKQLQPIYDKPMIYYPLSLLMLGGIKEILLITTKHDLINFQNLLGDGNQFGIQITYKVQDHPNGLPEAFILGEEFIKDDDVCLILGDNLFYGDISFFHNALHLQKNKLDGLKARVFAYNVADPRAYGVIEFDKVTKKVISIEEKPSNPKSNYALPGLYIFDSSVSLRAKKLMPSKRKETEIVDLILSYKKEDALAIEKITRGVAWLDTGTPRALLDASSYVCAIEERQGLKVACLEEVAYRMNYINLDGLKSCVENLPKSAYRQYLENFLKDL